MLLIDLDAVFDQAAQIGVPKDTCQKIKSNFVKTFDLIGAKPVSPETVYRKVQREYRTEDIESYVEDMYGEDKAEALSDDLIGRMLDRYEDEHDRNIAENNTWECVIRSVLEEDE